VSYAFKLPDLGEGLTEGEILQWMVAVGDEIKLNQPIVEVETAKAVVEVPSPYAGVVVALHVEAGRTVEPGGLNLCNERHEVERVRKRKSAKLSRGELGHEEVARADRSRESSVRATLTRHERMFADRQY